jgi:NADH dehydrogenase/NADH:ubiquinone oxidoreductase subunit G
MDTLVEKVQKRQVDAPNVNVFNSLVYVIQETRSHINRHISYVSVIAFLEVTFEVEEIPTPFHFVTDCCHHRRDITADQWPEHCD